MSKVTINITQSHYEAPIKQYVTTSQSFIRKYLAHGLLTGEYSPIMPWSSILMGYKKGKSGKRNYKVRYLQCGIVAFLHILQNDAQK